MPQSTSNLENRASLYDLKKKKAKNMQFAVGSVGFSLAFLFLISIACVRYTSILRSTAIRMVELDKTRKQKRRLQVYINAYKHVLVKKHTSLFHNPATQNNN